MATVVNTVGIGGSHDFSSWSAWAASLPANLVTDGNSYEGDGYFNGSGDGEFVVAGTVLTLSGHTTNSTHTILVTTGAGQSFKDNANAQTNGLRYNAANGVALRSTSNYVVAVSNGDDFVTFSGLQVKQSAANGGAGLHVGVQIHTTISQCIAETLTTASTFFTTGTILNSLGIKRASGGSIVTLQGSSLAVNCTFVVPSDLGAATNGATVAYGTQNFKNCTFFNCTNVKGGGGTPVFTTCMTDVASPPTGCTTVTYANQFVTTVNTNSDFKLKAGADCLDAGTTDTTDIPAANDIVGTSRPQGSAWDIGCWELVASSAACLPTRSLLGVGCGIQAVRAMIRNRIVRRRGILAELLGVNDE